MRVVVIVFLLFQCAFLFAQRDYVIIDSISVEGNRKTRASVILREMSIHVGDTVALADLRKELTVSEQFIMNTALFRSARITYKNWIGNSNRVHLLVEVQETWYIYPVPSFELADRNFNVWWVEYNASLARTNYGLDFTHLNTTGRGDRLKLSVQLGYVRNYFLKYTSQALNKNQTLGFNARFSYAQKREVNYSTINNKQLFYHSEEDFSYQQFNGELALSYRPGLRQQHFFTLGYQQNYIADEVSRELNPNFFLEGKSLQRFWLFQYNFTYDDRDVRAYPLNGRYVSAVLEKDGLGFYKDRNALTAQIEYHRFIPLGEKLNLGLISKGKLSLIRQRQPYNDNRAIGFSGNAVRGYEYYIIDGLDMVLINSSLRYPIWSEKINFGRLVPIDAFRVMPFKLYLSLNNDFGYVNNPFDQTRNSFNNRMLWGGGLGLDAVLFYDKVLRIEYSFNHLWESGIFLHFNMNI